MLPGPMTMRRPPSRTASVLPPRLFSGFRCPAGAVMAPAGHQLRVQHGILRNEALPLTGEEAEKLNKNYSCFHSELLPPLIAPTTGEDPSEWEAAEPAMRPGRSLSRASP